MNAEGARAELTTLVDLICNYWEEGEGHEAEGREWFVVPAYMEAANYLQGLVMAATAHMHEMRGRKDAALAVLKPNLGGDTTTACGVVE